MPSERLTGLLLICMGSVLSAQAPPALKVPDGTALRLSLTQELSSATNAVDDPVHFQVVEDVKIAGVVAFPMGSTAVGHIIEVEPRRRMGRAGKLNFTVDHVKAPDGSNLRLRASSTRKGEDKTGTVIIGSVLLSPLFLIMRGKDITIPKGTEITAYIDGDREFALMAPPVEPAVMQQNPTQSGTVMFRSDPDGADITIDGKFVGTTPSSLQLTAGDHSVVIEKAHFSSWKRTMTIAAGSSANVSATLDKAQ
jgi:PEGA domain